MPNAKRDDNRVPVIQGVSSVDNVTPETPGVDPVTHELLVKSSSLPGFSIPAFDYIGATYPDTSTEVYTYKTGGSGGTTVATITVVYSDAVTKLIITSVTKT